MAKKKRVEVAVIYARYSSHNQRDCSIEQQVAECRKFAAEMGMTVSEVYDDRAVSGKTDKRPNFQRMMHDAELGKFSVVLAWKSNRIGRNMLQAMMNEQRLNDLGVRCLYTEEDFDDTAAGRFALRSMMNVNQFYSENMAEDIRRGLMDNAKQCKVTGALPYGYEKAPDGRYAVKDGESQIVLEIFNRVAAGEQYSSIAADLNRRGLRTKGGKLWNKGSFHRMLSNERYKGIYIYSDVRVPDGIPRIISDELFLLAQEATGKKKNPQQKPIRSYGDYLLTGKLFCGLCGCRMVGVSGTGKAGVAHHYYACQNARKHTCSKKAIRRNVLEELVAQSICDDVLTDEVMGWIADQTVEYIRKLSNSSPASLYRAELAEVGKSIAGIIKAIEAGLFTPSMKERMEELETRKKDLQDRITFEEVSVKPIPRDVIVAGLELFRGGDVDDPEYRKALFDTFLKAVYVYDDEIKIVFSHDTKSAANVPLDADFAESVRVRMGDTLPHHQPFIRTPAVSFSPPWFVLTVPLNNERGALSSAP